MSTEIEELHYCAVKAGKVRSQEWKSDANEFQVLLDALLQPLPVLLYLLPVQDRSKPEKFLIEGLVLLPTAGVQGTYRRIGFFQVDGEEARRAFAMHEDLIEGDQELYDQQEAGVITLV